MHIQQPPGQWNFFKKNSNVKNSHPAGPKWVFKLLREKMKTQ